MNRPDIRINSSLSTKLLLLTILFVLFAELLLLLPSVAKERQAWFSARVEQAYLASLALEGPRDTPLDEDVLRQLFSTANILGVTINKGDMRMLILAPEINSQTAPDINSVDLMDERPLNLIGQALGTMLSKGESLIQANSAPLYAPGQSVDIIVSQKALRDHLYAYAGNILGLSLIISTLTASLVYWTLNRMIVRPVKRLTANIMAFESEPENPARILAPSRRNDEIGAAEQSLSAMQRKVRDLLGERRRLAALGAGISKISHDLRNILASAQLMSDRLARSDDPSVRKLAPRLLSALDRAITLSRDTLTFGRMEAALLDKSPFNLHKLIEEVFEDTANLHVAARNATPADLHIIADRTQLYRSLFNLARNAIEAMTAGIAAGGDDAGEVEAAGALSIAAQATDGAVSIRISDTGPGIPDHALNDLFEPFKGSQKPGGSGLGVAIAAEIIRAHGGRLALVQTGPDGTIFEILLPGAQTAAT